MTGDAATLTTAVAGGLNNQKLSLLGLCLLAQQRGAKVAFPFQVLDYQPASGSEAASRLPLAQVFAEAPLAGLLAEAGLLGGGEPTELRHADCFKTGAGAVRAERGQLAARRSWNAALLTAFQPAAPLREAAAALRAALPADTLGVQFRLEAQWGAHIAGKGWHEGDNGAQEIVLQPERLFAKIAAQPALQSLRSLFLCCDEEDLPFERRRVVKAARAVGLTAIFKSDLVPSERWPRLARSVIDFNICVALPVCVGLTTSTFSNMLCLQSSYEGTAARHFIYDAPGPAVLQRHDMGRATSPAAALQPPS